MAESIDVLTALDPDLLDDFRDEFESFYEIACTAVMDLERNPDNAEMVHELFRALHTVKGNASICHFYPVERLAHGMEEVVLGVREGRVAFTPTLGEVVLLSWDKLRFFVDAALSEKAIDTDDLQEIETQLKKIATAEPERVEEYGQNVISLFKSYVLGSSAGGEADDEPQKPVGSEIPREIAHFVELEKLLEAKLPYWEGRLERTLPLAVSINEHIDSPVDELQLRAAVVMHDAGLAFLPDAIILKDAALTADEWEGMKMHPLVGANILRLGPNWLDAAVMVEHHHERWDGKGYPAGLAGDDISIGAQIIAIVDAYESMRRPRPGRRYRRSQLRALTEINMCSGSQFNPRVVPAFNKVMRRRLQGLQ